VSPADATDDLADDGIVVSTRWLAARLAGGAMTARDGASRLCVVDIRGKVMPPGTKPRYVAKRTDYDAGHIPGAVFVDWTRDIVDAADPIPVQIAGPAEFAARMGELGIGDDTLVVAYDDYDHMFAGRLAWALRYHGHDGVRILDGGWARWLAEGRPTTTVVPAPAAPERPIAARVRPELRRTADDVALALGRSDVLIVDARAPDQYAGQVSAAGRGGHIPGARNVHYARLVDASTGKFLSRGELARAFAESGVDVEHLPPEVIVYCNGGVSCTVAESALRMLGRAAVAVYDGSWNEWGPDEHRPVHTGPRP
jgi:thiosulfate/3-mercaptopyruvate sulfurtransferase